MPHGNGLEYLFCGKYWLIVKVGGFGYHTKVTVFKITISGIT
jgi:hypothetical protein